MPSVKNIIFSLGALALAGTSQAYTLKFWEDKDSCANQDADSSRSRAGGETAECDSVLLGTQTVVIQDWDDNCRMLFWAEDQLCIDESLDSEPFYNSSKAEAMGDGTALFDDGNQACFNNLFERVSVGYYSYICS